MGLSNTSGDANCQFRYGLDPEDSTDQEIVLHALGERIKELRCMYGLARSIREKRTIEEVFRDLCGLIPPGWQYPDVTRGRVVFDGQEFVAERFEPTEWRLASDLVVDGKPRGAVEVYYLEEKATLAEGPFLLEERSLIDALAGTLAEAIEHKAAEQQLRAHRERLQRDVAERTAELTATNDRLHREIDERIRTEAQLLHSQEQLRSLTAQLALTEERERQRLGTALHDSVGQTLTAARLRLQLARAAIGDATVAEELSEVLELLDGAVGSTRRLMFDLSPPLLHDLGLAEAIQWLCERAEAEHGLSCEFRTRGGAGPIAEELTITLYQCARELLLHAAEHANAGVAVVVLDRTHEEVVLEVRDDGRGFTLPTEPTRPSTSETLGLFGVRERVTHLGGRFEIEAAPGGGTRIRIRCPSRRDARTDESRRRALARVGAHAETSSAPVVVVDEASSVVVWNRAAERTFGHPAGGVVGKSLADVLQPPDAAPLSASLVKVASQGLGDHLEMIATRADGSSIDLSVTLSPIRDRHGRPVGISLSARDISARKDAERALRRSERRYRELLSALNEGVWAIDAAGKTTFVNDRMAEMLGYSPAEMLGREIFDFMGESGVAVTQRNMERRRDGIREQHDFELLRKDGKPIYTIMETGPLTDDEGRYAGAIAGVVDITERREMELRLRQNEERLRQAGQPDGRTDDGG